MTGIPKFFCEAHKPLFHHDNLEMFVAFFFKRPRMKDKGHSIVVSWESYDEIAWAVGILYQTGYFASY